MNSRVRVMFWARVAGIGLVLGTISLNVMAILHARAMLEFSSSGARTKTPEALRLTEKLWVLLTGVNIPRPANSRTPLDVGLRFQTHQYPNGTGETLEAWYIPGSESKLLVVLFHGYAASKDSLLVIAAELHALGGALLLVDFYGSGGSSGTNTSLGFLEAKDVTASFRYATQHWPECKIVLYGVSMGGAAVLRSIATDAIQPDAIIVESTFDSLVNTARNRFLAMTVPATPFTHLLVFWGGWYVGYDGFQYNPSEYAKDVQCPALVLHGANDQRVIEPQARAVYDALGGWKSFAVYPEAGHEPKVSVQAAQWRKDVRHLLDTLK